MADRCSSPVEVPAASYVYRSRGGGVWRIDGCALRELPVTRRLRGFIQLALVLVIGLLRGGSGIGCSSQWCLVSYTVIGAWWRISHVHVWHAPDCRRRPLTDELGEGAE